MEAMANFSHKASKATIRDIVMKEGLCAQPAVGHPFSDIRVTRLNELQPIKNSAGQPAVSYNVDESSLYVFSTTDKNEVKKILSKSENNQGIKTYGPHDKDFSKVHEMLVNVEKRLHLFLEHCRKEKALDESFLRQIYMRAEKFIPLLFTIDNFQGNIQYTSQLPIFYPSFEDELETRMYIPPLFLGGAKQWIKNRHCDECGRIYFYKLERSRFCSEKCRMRTVRKK